MADNIYLKPLTVKSIEEILKMSSSRCCGKHKIDSVLPAMDGPYRSTTKRIGKVPNWVATTAT